MFSCEFCKISKKTCFAEHLWATASVVTVGTQSYESFLSYISFRKLIFVIFFCHMCYSQKRHDTSAWINKMTYDFNGTSSF